MLKKTNNAQKCKHKFIKKLKNRSNVQNKSF